MTLISRGSADLKMLGYDTRVGWLGVVADQGCLELLLPVLPRGYVPATRVSLARYCFNTA